MPAPPLSVAARCAAVALLLAIPLMLYWPGLHGGFIFDDHPNLVHDQEWKITGMRLAEWKRAAYSGISSASGRPLAVLSFAANHALTGMDTFWLKLTSLWMHCLNGLLVWMLGRRLIAFIPNTKAHQGPGTYAATLLALAWLVHPLQASTVLYIVQRMEIGAATGVLLALLFYLRARSAMLDGKARWWPWILGAVTATAFGLGFKESALLAPGFALAVELTLLRFRGPDGRTSHPLAWTYALLVTCALTLYAVVTIPILQSPTSYAGRDFTIGERLLTQLPVLAMYLKQSLLPLPGFFPFYYDNIPVSHGLFSPPTTAAAGGLLAALCLAALALRRSLPLVTLGIAWFFIAHSLTSNVVPLELAFEHRNYLALFGVLLALVQPFWLLGRRLHADARAVIGALPVAALAFMCVVQAGTWGNSLRLAWTLENRNPASPRASYALGTELLAAAGNTPGSPAWSLAYGQFTHAAALGGEATLPLQALLVLDGQRGKDIPAQRWQAFRDQLTAKPVRPEGMAALHAVSQCRIEHRCHFQDDELLTTFLAVLVNNPRNPTIFTMYANFLWNVTGDRALAIEVQRDAVAMAPERAASRTALAQFLMASGDEALAAEGRAVASALEDTQK